MATNQLKTRITADASQFDRVVGRLGRTVGTAAVGLAGAAIGAAVFSVKEAVNFEKKMAEVFTLLGNPPDDVRTKLTNDIRKMSVEFGQAKGELATGLYATLSAGIPAGNAIDFLTTGVKTAVASVTDTETAIKGLVGIINAYRLSADDAEMVSDKLFTAVKLGSTTYKDLAESLGKSNASANALGVGLDEMIVSLTAIINTEMDTARATTMLGAVMSSLATPSGDLEKRFKKLGFATAEDLIKTHGLVGGLRLLTKETGTSLSAISQLFGEKRAASGIISILMEGRIAAHMAEIGVAAGNQGVAFDIMAATTAHNLAQMKQDFLSTAEQMGSTLLPAVNELADALQIALNDPEVQQGIKAFFKGIEEGALAAAGVVQKLVEGFSFLADVGRKAEEKLKIKTSGGSVGLGDIWGNYVEYKRKQDLQAGKTWQQPGGQVMRPSGVGEKPNAADFYGMRKQREFEFDRAKATAVYGGGGRNDPNEIMWKYAVGNLAAWNKTNKILEDRLPVAP